MSRGHIAFHDRKRLNGSSPIPVPLTDGQKDVIEEMALDGYRDRQIAESLQIGEGQVQHWRLKAGIRMVSNRGSNQWTLRVGFALRPKHVIGEPGEREWFRSCDMAFQQAVLQAGGW